MKNANTTSPRPSPRPAPRRLILSLCLCLAALPLAVYVAAAQGGRQGEVGFDFDYRELSGMPPGTGLKIEVNNKLDQYDPTRTLVIMRATGSEGEISIAEGAQLSLGEIAGKRLKLGRGGSGGGGATSAAPVAIVTRIDWPGAEAAQLSARHEPYVRVERLPLPPSEYHFAVKVDAPGTDVLIMETDRQVAAGRSYTIAIEPPGFWASFKEKYATKESLLLTIIVGLVGMLIAALKEQLKAGLDWLLNSLGKFGSGKLAERRFTRLYLDVVASQHKYLKLVGFNTTGITRPLLEEVFVSLRISGFDHQQGTAGETPRGAEPKAEPPAVSFATALAQHPKMVILGGPGAGKTTTLSHTLLVFGQNKAAEKFGIEEDLLPVFIPLRRLSSSNRSILEDLLDKDTQILTPDLLKECPAGFFEKRLKKGRCILLLDGLDEVTDERTYRQVTDQINNFVAAYPKNRYVVTCRVAGWRSLLSGEFSVLQSQDFNPDEIQRFILGWHRAVITQSEHMRLQLDTPDKKKFQAAWAEHNRQVVKPAIEARSRSLLQAIDSNNRILSIAVNPMLLSLISLVHFIRHLLPRGRTILYSQCIELLIDAWDRSREITWHQSNPITPIQKESVLREIAFEFQRRGVGEDTRANLEAFIERTTSRLGISMPANELLEEIELRSGLLIERSIDVFGFSHLTLQEYLVAKHIQLNPAFYELLTANFDKQEWREVTLLYAGLLDDATDLIAQIVGAEPRRRLTLAGYCIGDAQHCDGAVSSGVIDELLAELDSGRGNDEVLVNVLSSVAADYDERAARVEEKLSEELINRVRAKTQPEESESGSVVNWMAILGKARITKSLPTLVGLFAHPQKAIRDQAVVSVAYFGNRALPAMHESLQLALRAQARDIWAKDAEFERVFGEKIEQQAGDSLSSPALYAAHLLAFIETAAGINTSLSAKLLLNLYALGSPAVHCKVSFTLARMLKNPLIEADLQQLDAADVRGFAGLGQADENGWSYARTPAQAGFLLLEKKVRDDLVQVIADPRRLRPVSYPEAGQLIQSASFKLLFPAIVEKIRDDFTVQAEAVSAAGVVFKYGRKAPIFLEMFGFSHPNDGHLTTLCGQIRKNTSMTVEHALRMGRGSNTSDSLELPRSARFANVAGNALFLVTTFICWGFVLFFGALIYSDPEDRRRVSFVLAAALVLPVLFHLGLAVASHLKLRRKILSVQLLGSLVFAFANFHKILPYLTRRGLWRKFLLLHVVAFFCSMLGVFFINQLWLFFSKGQGPKVSPDLLWLGLPNILFLLGGFIYLKYYVLAQNPIYQLISLHPEGKRLLHER